MPDTNPSIEDIVLGFQVQSTIDVPGRNESHRVTMGVLWNSEVLDIAVATGRRVAADDFHSRRLLVQIETLVQAITQIDEWVCFEPEDQVKNAELKQHLRQMLGRSAPSVVNFLWECYDQLRIKQEGLFQSRTDELKKSLRSLDPLMTLGVDPTDSSSGGVGGPL